MFRSLAIIAATLLVLVSPVRAGGNDADGCKDPTLLSRFPGFNIQRCTLNDFAAHKFLEENKEVTVEGCVPYEGSNALCVASVDDPEDK